MVLKMALYPLSGYCSAGFLKLLPSVILLFCLFPDLRDCSFLLRLARPSAVQDIVFVLRFPVFLQGSVRFLLFTSLVDIRVSPEANVHFRRPFCVFLVHR